MTICNICNTDLEYNLEPNLTPNEIITFRESLLCKKCGSASRDRAMMWALTNCISQNTILPNLPQNKQLKILESSGYRGHPPILESKFDYFNTLFEPEAIRKNINPRKYADFENLHFNDEFFDLILASDVFEHVRLDDKAFLELYRTLKPGGYFIMTVPFGYEQKETLIRVRPDGDKDIFLLPPEYHAENTLVYRVYGNDLFQKLNSFGFSVCYLHIQISQYVISKQEIFLCRKKSNPNMEFLDKEKGLIIFKKEYYRAEKE